MSVLSPTISFYPAPYLGLSFEIGCTRNWSVPTGYRYAGCPVLDVPTWFQLTRRWFTNSLYAVDVIYYHRIDETVAVYSSLPRFTHIFALQFSAFDVTNGTWLGTSLPYQSVGSQKLSDMASEIQWKLRTFDFYNSQQSVTRATRPRDGLSDDCYSATHDRNTRPTTFSSSRSIPLRRILRSDEHGRSCAGLYAVLLSNAAKPVRSESVPYSDPGSE